MSRLDATAATGMSESAARGRRDGDSVGDKLLREVDLIVGGAVTGTRESWQHSVDHPGESLIKVSSAAVIAGALALAQKRTGVVGLAAQIGAGALGISFLADVNGRVGVTWKAIGNTWDSPENLEANKRVVGHTVGPFLVDSGLFMAGGAAGAGIARGGVHLFSRGQDRVSVPVLRQAEPAPDRVRAIGLLPDEPVNLSGITQAPVDLPQTVHLPGLQPGLPANARHVLDLPSEAPLARLYRQATGSVGKIEVIAGGYPTVHGEVGTGFAVSKDGKIATAFHVVQDALSVSVIDAGGRPHAARVEAVNPERDIAILQLEQPGSHAVFKPIELGDVAQLSPQNAQVAAFGHPNGWNVMFASPGRMSVTLKPSSRARFEMHGEHGNSGSPIVDQSGKAVAMLIQSPRSGTDTVFGAFGKHVAELVGQTTTSPAKVSVTSDRFTVRSSTAPSWEVPQPHARYTIADAEAALANIKSIFGPDVFTSRPIDFFHSKVKKVEILGPSTLVLKTEFNPIDREITVRPIGLDGAQIPADMMWPASMSRMRDAELRLRLDENNRPVFMEARHDPLMLLPQAFNFRGESNYLALLRPDSASRPH